MEHVAHLNKDRRFRKILLLQDPCVIEKRNAVHLRLCASIISQQLSTKVAAVIYQRFLSLYSKKTPSSKDILQSSIEELRSIGLSNAKAQYVKNVCQFFIDNKITDAKIHAMEDEELIDFLVQIKGIGRWTVEMLLMFTLGREDVFAVDDLGIQQAMTKIYQLDPSDKKTMKAEMIKIAEKWRPYRTYACRYLWDWKDDKSIQ